MTEALFYEKKSDKTVKCNLCPHFCIIKENERGYCGVRKNQNGTLYAITTGLIIAAASDPIEKKPLYHFYPGSRAYSLGGFGCNLACVHCQNHNISQVRDELSFSRLQRMSPEQIVNNALKSECKVIAWTYNEPTIWYEYILATSKLAKVAGLKTVLITNGVINIEPLKYLMPYIDAYRIDVKGFTNNFYKKLTGFSFLNSVLKSGETAYSEGCHIEVVSNIIPGWNDGKEHIEGIARWIIEKMDNSVPWHVTAYYPAHELTEEATSTEILRKA
ncbi:MAG: AmmeMemoRadiSam system radical SAM enzyme, partial [Spirochaetaceae bacterium]|nr:AmmeMemoRadiSam system radical SAM enzyme [Spirochaetaceae bacterium]